MNHPATFTSAILTVFADIISMETGDSRERAIVLDPFAGVGTIHDLAGPYTHTVGVEIEPEWASLSEWTIAGDSRDLPFPEGTFDAVATSPAYGNRMADQYDGRDGSKRHTYRIALGRPLTAGNGAGLQWGQGYRDLHCAVWRECWRVLKPRGILLVNLKDHIRGGKRQFVTAWHKEALTEIGFVYEGRKRVTAPGIRHGANHALRLDWEVVMKFRKPEGK